MPKYALGEESERSNDAQEKEKLVESIRYFSAGRLVNNDHCDYNDDFIVFIKLAV